MFLLSTVVRIMVEFEAQTLNQFLWRSKCEQEDSPPESRACIFPLALFRAVSSFNKVQDAKFEACSDRIIQEQVFHDKCTQWHAFPGNPEVILTFIHQFHLFNPIDN